MTFLTDIFRGLWSHIILYILSDFEVWLLFMQNAKQSKVVLLNTEKLLDQDIVAARAAWVMLSCSKARASISFWWPGCASASTVMSHSNKDPFLPSAYVQRSPFWGTASLHGTAPSNQFNVTDRGSTTYVDRLRTKYDSTTPHLKSLTEAFRCLPWLCQHRPGLREHLPPEGWLRRHTFIQ